MARGEATTVVREFPLHRQIADVLALEIAPAGKVSKAGVCWWSIDHASFAGHAGARVGRGVIAGIPDIQVIYRGRAHVVEIKTLDGILSLDQRSVATAILIAGGYYGIARNADEVLDLLDGWQIPRARRTGIRA